MKNRWIRFTVLAGAFMLVLSGCSNNTEDPVVTPRTEAVEMTAAAAADTPDTGGEAVLQTETSMMIADQVEAPDSYKIELTEGNTAITVTGEAAVIVPEAEGIKLKKVASRMHTQEEIDAQMEVLLDGNTLMERSLTEEYDYIRTKDEIKGILDKWDEANASGTKFDSAYLVGDDISYEELWEQYETAPETVESEVVEANIDKHREESGNGYHFYGEAEVDGKLYGCFSSGEENGLGVSLVSLYRDSYLGNFYGFVDADDPRKELPEPKTPIEELQQQAETILKELGQTDMQIFGYEDQATDIPLEGEYTVYDTSRGYGFYVTRVIEGIPINYTTDHASAVMQQESNAEEKLEEEAWENSDGSVKSEMSEGMNLIWYYETIKLSYDDSGLVSFAWESPYTVTALSDDYVFLLPFAEIQDVFEKLVITKYSEEIDEFVESIDIDVCEVRLGYARTQERMVDGVGEGTLVPVWEFYGTKKYTYLYEDGNEVYQMDGKFQSILAINAMDGTIVERSLDY